MNAHLVFPHQLIEDVQFIPRGSKIFLVEEQLFFRQYNFHKQKLVFHRASMKAYAQFLEQKGFAVEYIEVNQAESDIRCLIPLLQEKGIQYLSMVDVTDNWLETRINRQTNSLGLGLTLFKNPIFMLEKAELDLYFATHKRYFQTDFYIHFRKQKRILTDAKGQAMGGKWSFDSENRLKYPSTQIPPPVQFPTKSKEYKEAELYISGLYPKNPGDLTGPIIYPTTFQEAKDWLDDFLIQRFYHFGAYEDAIPQKPSILHHSVLSPLLNVGLLTPSFVLEKAIAFGISNALPLASVEGFVRQILGWREFIRAIYQREGSGQRTRNFWNFHHSLPASFYTGETGILPIDTIIKKNLTTAYNHHIERLMILGNFMLLCEIHPDAVYQWFMEMYIDAYDWVMVPNVYGMSQFADGGKMCTKPYISGSNYLLKMSDYLKTGEWQSIWDALFWRFMNEHRSFFLSNPRLGMLVRTWDKNETSKKSAVLTKAENYLSKIHGL